MEITFVIIPIETPESKKLKIQNGILDYVLQMSSIKVLIHVLLQIQKTTDDYDNVANMVMDKLRKLNFEGFPTISHIIGTNYISIHLKNKKNLTLKIKRMEKIKEIGYFVLWIYPKEEILDAVAEHDYFKAFSLCSTTYEFFGKTILTNHIKKKNLNVDLKRIKGLKLNYVIKELHNYKLISKSLKSDMVEVNKIRINFIHHKLYKEIAREDFMKISQNIPKIKRSINELEKLYAISN